jgi:hypothetical protein
MGYYWHCQCCGSEANGLYREPVQAFGEHHRCSEKATSAPPGNRVRVHVHVAGADPALLARTLARRARLSRVSS